jgi:hypothetical protein
VALTPDACAREIKMRELSKAEKENANNAKDRKKAQRGQWNEPLN